jgi:hypothetical protein
MLLLSFLQGTRVNGHPSTNDLAKAAVSDGFGPHTHGPFESHEHGEPSYTDDEATFLASQGLHVDQHHGRVYVANGLGLSPHTASAMLIAARDEGTLKASCGPRDMMAKGSSPVVAVGSSSPGEGSGPVSGSPAAQHLDLRGEWSGPG